jgi:hypothetical protein
MSVAATSPRTAMRDRREAELLELPSVDRMATLLSRRGGAASWVRLAVTSLDRFRVAMMGRGAGGLEGLLAGAAADRHVADRALAGFARSLHGRASSQVEALAFGAKLWFRFGGASVTWRPLSRQPDHAGPVGATPDGDLRLVLQSLVGSGLTPSELLSLRLGDVGQLSSVGELQPDPLASPLALQVTPGEPGDEQRITFLPFQARDELSRALARREAAGETLDESSPLVSAGQCGPAGAAVLERARWYHERLIEAGNDVNVATCRVTGDFFRAWGMPGARFEARTREEMA